MKKKCEYYTQKELNSLYELLDMKIATKYSYIAKTLLMTFFYMPIFPISTFISILGFILGYFIEKFNVSKMYKRPEMLNSKICEFYSNYYILNLLMLSIGNYIFIRDIKNSLAWPMSNIIIFVILLLVPYNQIFAFNFIEINESEIKKNKTYYNYFFHFYNDYERINPMKKKDGIKNFFKKLIKNALISKREYDIIINNFDKINLMETYYKARKNFNNSIIQRAFLSLSKGKYKMNKNSKFIDNFRDFLKKNGSKAINFLFFLNIPDKTAIDSSNTNNAQNISQIHKDYDITIMDYNNVKQKSRNNFIEVSDKKEIKQKSQEFMENLIKNEQNKILSLYNNPLLFGIRAIFNSIYLNKDEEEEHIQKINDIKDVNNINIYHKEFIEEESHRTNKSGKKQEKDNDSNEII